MGREFSKHLFPLLPEQSEQAFHRSGLEAFRGAESGLCAAPAGGGVPRSSGSAAISVAKQTHPGVHAAP